MKKVLLLVCVLAAGWVSSASAIPILQVYIEGATYDAGSQTWLTTSGNFRLWVVGNFDMGETIGDVRLSAANYASEPGSITLAPTTTSYGGVTDTYAPGAPLLQYTGIGASPADLDGDGDIDKTPVMSDGSDLPTHGIFGPLVNWKQWALGDMTRHDETLIGDFQTSFPALGPQMGEIFAYDVTITGFEHGVHFDAFNHVMPPPTSASVFAPFSHDAGATIPEPGTLLLLGTGFATLAAAGMRRNRNRK